jgi:glycosyltransferase involved in cell wall biosynthesis
MLACEILEELIHAKMSLTKTLFDRLEREIKQSWPKDFSVPKSLEANLVARPCSLSARNWHLGGLQSACEHTESHFTPAIAERIKYHARWLRFLGEPNGQTYPRVTVVIPIYNRARFLPGLIKNCLAQSYPKVEIVIVDDGSTDDLESAVRPFEKQVKFIRQPNGGVSSARNAAIKQATGEFIQFLDSDNLLAPDCVEAKIQAFAQVPDADLCYCAPIEFALFDVPPSFSKYRVPVGGIRCPTNDLLLAVLNRAYPFLVSSVMLPRWVVLDTGPFDEDLSRAEDGRYWFKLALRRTKVIGLRRKLFFRSLTGGGLSARGKLKPSTIVRARNLRDLLRRPSLWNITPHYLAATGRAARRILADVLTSEGAGRDNTAQIAIIVPVLDEPLATESTLTSCLNQSRSTEILVLDRDLERAKTWPHRFPGVRATWLPDPDGGLAYARNIGVIESKARLIRFLRPGDVLMPNSVLEQVRTLWRASKGCIVIEGQSLDTDAWGGADRISVASLIERGMSLPFSALLFPRRILKEVGGFDELLGEAHESRYLLRLAAERATISWSGPTESRFQPSRSATPKQSILAAIANFAQALRTPSLWACLPRLAAELTSVECQPFGQDILVQRVLDYLFCQVEELKNTKCAPSPLTAYAPTIAGLHAGYNRGAS